MPCDTGPISTGATSYVTTSGPLGSWPCIGRAAVVARIAAVLQSSSARRAALVRSVLGGGKSRVIDEVVSLLEAKRRTLRRIVATSATSAVPFGAVAHLLPVGSRDSADPLLVIASLRDVLAASEGGDRPVLILDDVPQLDLATAGVVATLAGDGLVDVVAAARSDAPIPDPLVDLLLGDGTLVVNLDPLTDDDVDTLLHLVLGGPVDGGALVSLGDRSGGNPLFLRELTRSALDGGALVEVGGVWRLRGNVPGSTRLREVVESRLEVASDANRPALELLALCELVDVDELESMVGLEALVELEERGLVRVLERAGRHVAILGHPLHGEAIRLAMPAMRVRLLMRNHVRWVEENLVRWGDADELQLALWRLDAGLIADLDSLLHGAELAQAMHDSASVVRLGEPLFSARPTGDLGQMLVDAYFQLGRFADALELVDRAARLDAPSAVHVDLAARKANVLLWSGDADGALAALDAARHDPRMTDDDIVRISAEHASVLVHSGRPGEALRELEEAATSDRMQLKLGAAVAYANALSMAGRTTDAVEWIDRAIEMRVEHASVTGVADLDAYYTAKAFALAEGGRLAEAKALGELEYEKAVIASRPLPQYWFVLLIGRCELLAGRGETARNVGARARALGLDAGLGAPVRLALSSLALAQTLVGDLQGAAATVAEAESLPPFGFLGAEAALAEGWTQVSGGDLLGGRDTLLAGARHGAATGHIGSAIWLLHDVARLGRPAEVVEEITALAEGTQSALAATRAAHVRAMVSGDAAQLAAVCEAFADLGVNLAAAEAAVAAADAARNAGDQRAAAAHTVRAERLAALCDGAQSPVLSVATSSVDPLTDREREIAFLAANEMTSREIADKLFLSYRTVNNHLQHIYDKLGIRGRNELSRALGLGADKGEGSADMDTAGIALVQSTFVEVLPIADRLAEVFYDKLFAMDPSVRAMFPADMTAQRQKLIDELQAIVASLGRIHELAARTTELGRRHADYGVEPHHYELVQRSLLAALAECLPSVMTHEAINAWRRAHHIVAETMMYGAAHGAST